MRLRTLLFLLVLTSILQLGLLWIQGAQLHRQHETLQALRIDIQDLADLVEQGPTQDGGEGHWMPSRHRGARGRWNRVALQEEDPAAKELRESRESAQKAVKEARQAQRKLSVQEAAKRAEETEKVRAAEHAWTRWVWIALGAVTVALLARAWLRRR